MQTEIHIGSTQDFPSAQLSEFAEQSVPAPPADSPVSTTQPSQIAVAPDALGTFRGAVYCLPVAMVMWAIIIAAVAHFLIR